jgi:hypothetical protein
MPDGGGGPPQGGPGQLRPAAPAGSRPRSGDETSDLFDGGLATLAQRRGAWLGDDLALIILIAGRIDQARTVPA